MDATEDFIANAFGGNNTAVLVAAVVVLFALIGMVAVVGDSFESDQRKTAATPKNRFRKLKALLLGGLAIAGPRLFKAVASRPDFVDGLDRVLDRCQSKLREMVVSTASVRDDAILDAIDAVIDGFQEELRRQVLLKAAEWENPDSNRNSKRKTRR